MDDTLVTVMDGKLVMDDNTTRSETRTLVVSRIPAVLSDGTLIRKLDNDAMLTCLMRLFAKTVLKIVTFSKLWFSLFFLC